MPSSTASDLARFDALALRVSQMPRAEWLRRTRAMEGDQRAEAMRLRYRWRVDEFAQDVMSSALARLGPVSPPGEVDDVLYGLAPHRAGERARSRHVLVMTGRGVGKTTRQKVRALHGLLYGARRVSAAIGATDGDAIGWVDTLRGWCEDPPALLPLLFPELRCSGSEHHLRLSTRYGEGHLLARSITGALRGMNVRGARPDALDLDDIESEDRSQTEGSRNATQARISGKILPLVPLEGGAEVWWVQTPVHHDAVAVRAWRGSPELRAWESYRLPVVRRWPDREDLWQQCRAMYFDVDAYGSREGAAAAAEAYYQAHQAEMDAGMECLDPLRMGPFAAHVRRWEVGELAWAREYEVQAVALGGGVLGLDRWPRYVREGSVLRIGNHSHPIAGGQLSAHFDPSDGGDDGALVVTVHIAGRYYVLLAQTWQSAKLSQQVAELPALIAPFVALGLKRLSWEPPVGAASVVREQLTAALRLAGLSLPLDDWHSTENKQARILATLEPLGAGSLIALPHDLPYRLVSQGMDFDPSRTDNADDWLDALQRAIEYHRGKRWVSAANVSKSIAKIWGSR